jgi:hypothetical protein
MHREKSLRLAGLLNFFYVIDRSLKAKLNDMKVLPVLKIHAGQPDFVQQLQ